IARGLDPELAAAREVSGYYTLRAERDALAALVRTQEPEAERRERERPKRERKRAGEGERPRHLLGLFAYHRDAPLVARALLASLSEVGPRRTALAAKLGETESTLLARFRAAGLEREFALRERDLIRALWSKHRASESRVAAELQATPPDLRRIAAERGL